MATQTAIDLAAFEGEYDEKFIMDNPIPAKCKKCKREFVDDARFKEAIRAPLLESCRCFYCSGKLAPLDPAAYRAGLEAMKNHRQAYQPGLFSVETAAGHGNYLRQCLSRFDPQVIFRRGFHPFLW
jgi:hypothetical protein